MRSIWLADDELSSSLNSDEGNRVHWLSRSEFVLIIRLKLVSDHTYDNAG